MLQNIKKLLSSGQKKQFSPEERSRIMFHKYAREQFMRLREKGLSITVMTL